MSSNLIDCDFIGFFFIFWGYWSCEIYECRNLFAMIDVYSIIYKQSVCIFINKLVNALDFHLLGTLFYFKVTLHFRLKQLFVEKHSYWFKNQISFHIQCGGIAWQLKRYAKKKKNFCPYVNRYYSCCTSDVISTAIIITQWLYILNQIQTMLFFFVSLKIFASLHFLRLFISKFFNCRQW